MKLNEATKNEIAEIVQKNLTPIIEGLICARVHCRYRHPTRQRGRKPKAPHDYVPRDVPESERSMLVACKRHFTEQHHLR